MFASGKAASASAATYIEDVFSTYLTTGTGVSNTQTVTNGIDLAGKGGLVWGKSRNVAGSNHILVDTARGVNTTLSTDNTDAQVTSFPTVSSFLSNGFTATNYVNSLADTFAFWTFREQPKFFDVVTYTGNLTARTIAHNLGSVPGCIIVKRTDGVSNWAVYHRSVGNAKYLNLNNTNPESGWDFWNYTTPTSTVFSIGANSDVNTNGATYVAYLFAHDAGGFGLTGTDNVISCGSYTGNGSTSGPSVTLGYEPQFVMIKNATATGNWGMYDVMRGIPTGGYTALLSANTTAAETTGSGNLFDVTATGFQLKTTAALVNTSGATYIYIAIRRGPMKVPTSGTSVFKPAVGALSVNTVVTTGFVTDATITCVKDLSAYQHVFEDRLRSFPNTNGSTAGRTLNSTANTAEETTYPAFYNYTNTTAQVGDNAVQGLGNVFYFLGRAPNFFDEVCYTGTGATIALNHNLAAVPELMIVKSRGAATGNWVTYTATYGSGSFIRINSTSGNNTGAGNLWGATTPTSSLFYVGEGSTGGLSVSANNYVAYLFATCAGVSKVGSYTGTGTTKQVNCGFTGGARFVLIKRTDSSGDWYVWDSARGIVAGNDPYLLLNSTAAEVTSTDYIDTYSAGFEISSTAPAAINASGGTFIFFAVA